MKNILVMCFVSFIGETHTGNVFCELYWLNILVICFVGFIGETHTGNVFCGLYW